MRSCDHEHACSGIAVRTGGIEFLKRLLRSVGRISFCLEYDAGTCKGALLREAEDEIAFLAPGAKPRNIASSLHDARCASHGLGDELGHRLADRHRCRGAFAPYAARPGSPG